MGNRVTLVFGLPRSGTTWLGKIFDSHPMTLYRHEPDSVERISGVPLLPDAPDAGTGVLEQDLECAQVQSIAVEAER